MGIPWKNIGRVLLGLGKSGIIPIPGLPAMIEGVESAVEGHGQGKTKFDIVDKISDVALAELVDLDALSPEQREQLTSLKTAYINTYVAAKNIEAQVQVDAKMLQDFIAGLKKKPSA